MSRKKKSKAHWQAVADLPDYGEFTGFGSSDLPTYYNRLVVRVSPGWREAVADQPGGARLVRFADGHGEDSVDFKRVLGQWVRERLDRGLPIPESIEHEWKMG
jgi:hypothetical protein